MLTLEELRQQRDGLLKQRDGVRSTRIGDHEATWKSDKEIAAALAAIDREIASREGRRVTTFLPHFSKGL